MSGNSNNSLLPFSLPKWCKGYEKYASWETYMITHRALCGLVNYWKDKVTIPNDPTQVNVPPASTVSPPSSITISLPSPTSTVPPASTISPPSSITIASPSSTSTPLHSLTPNFLEYQLCESITMLSILINLIDIPGTRVNPRGKSHETWKQLDQYGKPSERTRNMREQDLDECKYVEGSKVTSKGGHIERMRILGKLANDVGANFDNARFRTKLINSFPESWDVICSICYSMTSLSQH